MYLKTPYKISFDTVKYPFRQIVSKILETSIPLEDLHLVEHYDVLTREKDQKTIWHQKYYNKFLEEFYPTYVSLISELKETFGYDSLIYQKIPTFRVQLANGNLAVGEWHRDRTYNHGVTEVNFWMPFINTNSANTIWLESKEDKGDYRPYNVNYGEILVFDGANLHHGNKPNTSLDTRVSVDFRLVDPAKFIANEAGSINMNTKFDVGSYFEQL